MTKKKYRILTFYLFISELSCPPVSEINVTQRLDSLYLKGTVNLTASDPLLINWHVRFTTVYLKYKLDIHVFAFEYVLQRNTAIIRNWAFRIL